jgi:hypothetical protein
LRTCIKSLVLLFGAAVSGFSQTREETIEFITREIRSYESRTFAIRELAFQENGAVFKIRRGPSGGGPDKTLLIPLKNVNIFAARIRNPSGTETYNLAVRCRGKDQPITVNNLVYHGNENIIGRIPDRRQALALERAFAHLTELTTGRRDLFTGR